MYYTIQYIVNRFYIQIYAHIRAILRETHEKSTNFPNMAEYYRIISNEDIKHLNLDNYVIMNDDGTLSQGSVGVICCVFLCLMAVTAQNIGRKVKLNN